MTIHDDNNLRESISIWGTINIGESDKSIKVHPTQKKKGKQNKVLVESSIPG
jgi:hypothetical protein